MADSNLPPTDPTSNESASLDSLESEENTLESTGAAPPAAGQEGESAADSSPPPPQQHNRFRQLLRQLRRRINLYLLLFTVIILIAGAIILIAYLQSRQSTLTNQLQTQSLSQNTLNQLANSDATVGNSQSILNVESSAIFAGQVLVRQNLQVAGNLQIGGTVALSNITVAGSSQFGQVTVNKNLAVSGDTAIQGTTTIAKSLQVNGNGTFNGPVSAPQVSTGSLQLNGDLVLTHHINTGGTTPSRSSGTALGSGGSVSISGSDTAGSITINTGSSPAAGCFVTVNFTAKYNATPHVQVTPIGSAAGGLAYYVNRSTISFSVCDNTAPPAGSSFGFDYFVVD
jgi:cytoskeletal protein CcmA (bactofilin family)